MKNKNKMNMKKKDRNVLKRILYFDFENHYERLREKKIDIKKKGLIWIE